MPHPRATKDASPAGYASRAARGRARPPRTLLVGDIGGTKSLLATASTDGSSVLLRCVRRYATMASADLAALLRAFLNDTGARPEAACLGVPGPVVAGECRTPNLPWTLSEREIAASTGVRRVLLVNDFAAAARGVSTVAPEHLVPLQQGEAVDGAPLAVIGAGTGLGEAVLVRHAGRLVVLSSEAGHADFSPQGDLQRALAAELEGSLQHVSVERVVSGPGLVRIYEFLLRHGFPAADEVAAADPGARPEAIARLALGPRQPTCDQALDVFVRALGAEAGNLALRCLALGGVVLAGGIAPKILPRLLEGGFMAAFLAKGRMRGVLRRLPVTVCTDPETPLRGAALYAYERTR